MEINTNKTKSLVFNSTGRLFPVTFMIDNQLSASQLLCTCGQLNGPSPDC